MSISKKDSSAKWRKKRQIGKQKYIINYGVITWGVTLTVIFSLIEFFTSQTLSLGWLIMRFAMFSFIGIFIANYSWEKNERKYTPRKP